MEGLSEIKISLKELAELCAKYDNNGKETYPESEYEGFSVFEEIYCRLLDPQNVFMPDELRKQLFPYTKRR